MVLLLCPQLGSYALLSVCICRTVGLQCFALLWVCSCTFSGKNMHSCWHAYALLCMGIYCTYLILYTYMLFCKGACFLVLCACTTVVCTCSFLEDARALLWCEQADCKVQYCQRCAWLKQSPWVTICRKVTKSEFFTLNDTTGYFSPQKIILGHLSFKR